ncbi:hypothetical protein K438DRAFT_1784912 [Mycena galopus ATCC 62051]|nr:hypothetical protein K438DRAFT_1784912 [Mycena galopus ATCC 62051]
MYLGRSGWWCNQDRAKTERLFQINYLSNAILSVRLLPLLRASAQSSGGASYLSIVGSRAISLHSFTKHPVPDTISMFAFLNDRAQFRGMQRYSDTKRLVFDASVVFVNNVCLGMVQTNFETNQPWWLVGVAKRTSSRSPEVGARLLINAVSAGPGSHGKLLGDYIEQTSGQAVRDS